jgi:hypothetical protein
MSDSGETYLYIEMRLSIGAQCCPAVSSGNHPLSDKAQSPKMLENLR